MKKKVLNISFNVVLITGLIMSFVPSQVEAQEADLTYADQRVVRTRCVRVSDGVTVGFSNNCAPGDGGCTDRFCAQG